MQVPKEYQVVNGYDPLTHRQTPDTLAAQVNRLIREGWIPVGGVTAYVDGYPGLLQAMVRYDE